MPATAQVSHSIGYSSGTADPRHPLGRGIGCDTGNVARLAPAAGRASGDHTSRRCPWMTGHASRDPQVRDPHRDGQIRAGGIVGATGRLVFPSPTCCQPSPTRSAAVSLSCRKEQAKAHRMRTVGLPISGKPVTNQVTTTPGHSRRSATQSDTDIRLTCRNTTPCDVAGRNRQAWHARGQGFESPKLHVFAAQEHISILKMIFDLLHARQEGQGLNSLSFTFPQVSSTLRSWKNGL